MTLSLLVLDVDGVLTDGTFLLPETGDELKAFHASDGLGLRLLQDAGVKVALLSGRKSRIVERRAERDWAIAAYYDNKKQYGAARKYYESIIQEYPQTQFARQATARLEEIRGAPDEPPNRFQWLTDSFEAEAERSRQAGRFGLRR